MNCILFKIVPKMYLICLIIPPQKRVARAHTRVAATAYPVARASTASPLMPLPARIVLPDKQLRAPGPPVLAYADRSAVVSVVKYTL